MANTAPLSYRIDSNLKAEAESILNKLGISPTSAIQMFYKQVILEQGIPFEVKLNKNPKPISIGNISKEEFDQEILKGLISLKKDKKYTSDEIDEILAKEFGI